MIAAPIGVGDRGLADRVRRGPSWLARAVESGVEIVAGTPSIVLAIFGLLVFQQGFFGFLSFTATGGVVFGRSFLIAGAMMSLIALPLIVGATREALQSIPRHVREASYALGKDRASTIRRVLLPASRPRDRHRDRARHGPDRRRHGDRRDPARRLAAARAPQGEYARSSASCAAPAAR